jgi:hypothetical protein
MVTRTKPSKKVYDRKKERKGLESWDPVRTFTI